MRLPVKRSRHAEFAENLPEEVLERFSNRYTLANIVQGAFS
jgi:hypothetical protein